MFMKSQDIIELLFAFAGCAGFFILFAAFLIYAFTQSRKRQQVQKELLAAAPQVSDSVRTFAVKYAGERKFKSFLKVFPWEASGVLRLAENEISFQGARTNSQPITIAFALPQTRASYIGIKLINGATAWFMLEENGSKHYFTAETGVTVFGTQKGSKEILEVVNIHLSAATQNLKS